MLGYLHAQTNPPGDLRSLLPDDLVTPALPVVDYLASLYRAIADQVLSASGALQILIVLVSGVVALGLSRPAHREIARLWPGETTALWARGRTVLDRLVLPSVWVIGLWVGSAALRGAGLDDNLVGGAASLLIAWIVIRVFSSLVSDPFWANAFALAAWVVAALNILNLLGPSVDLLDSVAITFGDRRFSLYLLIKGGVLAAILLWLASASARLIQRRIQRSTRLTPSVQSLIAQAIRLALLFIAASVALNAVGLDLTTLTVFSGAVGIGVGFGLQSVFSNLVAGIIMLFERSVKVGDFVEIEGGTTGEVREINIRSTLITTNDNIDVLVPNSEFVSKRVTNWTLREAVRRAHIPFGVAYGTDKDLVRKAGLEAAAIVPHGLRGLRAREADVWLVGFGDSSLNFELVVWLNSDAVKRPAKVVADYNWAIESALKKYGIEIPFPQRDLHIRSGTLSAATAKRDDSPA